MFNVLLIITNHNFKFNMVDGKGQEFYRKAMPTKGILQ